jgi:hypothetical protein
MATVIKPEPGVAPVPLHELPYVQLKQQPFSEGELARYSSSCCGHASACNHHDHDDLAWHILVCTHQRRPCALDNCRAACRLRGKWLLEPFQIERPHHHVRRSGATYTTITRTSVPSRMKHHYARLWAGLTQSGAQL